MGGIARENGMKAIVVGGVERTVRYIRSQAEHHSKMTFQEELVRFLKKHGIPYDERYLWD